MSTNVVSPSLTLSTRHPSIRSTWSIVHHSFHFRDVRSDMVVCYNDLRQRHEEHKVDIPLTIYATNDDDGEAIEFQYSREINIGSYGAVYRYTCDDDDDKTIIVKVPFEREYERQVPDVMRHMAQTFSIDDRLSFLQAEIADYVGPLVENDDGDDDDKDIPSVKPRSVTVMREYPITLASWMNIEVANFSISDQQQAFRQWRVIWMSIVDKVVDAHLRHRLSYFDIKVENIFFVVEASSPSSSSSSSTHTIDVVLGDLGSFSTQEQVAEHEITTTYESPQKTRWNLLPMMEQRDDSYRLDEWECVWQLGYLFYDMVVASLGPSDKQDVVDLAEHHISRERYLGRCRHMKRTLHRLCVACHGESNHRFRYMNISTDELDFFFDHVLVYSRNDRQQLCGGSLQDFQQLARRRLSIEQPSMSETK
jgi:hypothetical protein